MPTSIEVHHSYRQPQSRTDKNIFEWELDILAKEIILHAPSSGTRSLRNWKTFSATVNELKKLENGVADIFEDVIRRNIFLELFRHAHRQFPWQRRPQNAVVIRFFKIFSHPDIDILIQRRIGLSANELFTIGLMLTGHFFQEFEIRDDIRVNVPNILPEQVARFIEVFSKDINELRTDIDKVQSYDQDFAYSFNPLMQHPLVRCLDNGRSITIAPIPTYLFRRFTEGVYYEICNEPAFGAAFGQSFQRYVGEAAEAINSGGRFNIIPEHEYLVGKDRKDSTDWIIADSTAALFIECKTKKVRYGSKFRLIDTALLEEDLAKMAASLVQTYKTLADGLAGFYSRWKSTGLPIYPIIVTLEEWYAFGDHILPAIDALLEDGMKAAGLDFSLREKYPYTICAVADFELALQVMNEITVENFMKQRFKDDKKFWPLDSFMKSEFKGEIENASRNLFRTDLAKIHPLLGDKPI